jgi:hypothetical protein
VPSSKTEEKIMQRKNLLAVAFVLFLAIPVNGDGIIIGIGSTGMGPVIDEW